MCRGLEELRREHVLEEEDEERDEDLGDDEPDDDDLEAGAVGVGELRVEDLEELLEDVEALVEELDAVGDVEVVPERDVGRLVFVVLPEPVGAYEREPRERCRRREGRKDGGRALSRISLWRLTCVDSVKILPIILEICFSLRSVRPVAAWAAQG